MNPENSESSPEQPETGHFNESNGSILIPIDKHSLELEALEPIARAEALNRKPEFHVTIFGSTTGQLILNRLNEMAPDERTAAVSQIQDLVAATNWDLTEKVGDVYKISKEYNDNQAAGDENPERRESIIKMVELEGTQQFFTRLNELLKTDFEPPPTHITLFAKSTNPKNATRGIGIASMGEFVRLNPVLVEV